MYNEDFLKPLYPILDPLEVVSLLDASYFSNNIKTKTYFLVQVLKKNIFHLTNYQLPITT